MSEGKNTEGEIYENGNEKSKKKSTEEGWNQNLRKRYDSFGTDIIYECACCDHSSTIRHSEQLREHREGLSGQGETKARQLFLSI
jgi:hypothetical protein